MIENSELILDKLKAQFDQLQLVFINVSEGVIVINADGSIVDMNPAALTMYGFENLDQAAKTLSESAAPIEFTYLDGNTVSQQDLPLNRIRRGEQFYNFELLVRRIDTGDTFFANYNGTCVYDEQHKMILAVLTFRNVTERKRMEDAVRIREAEYRAIFELAGSGKMQIDPVTLRFTRINPKLTEITGYLAQELLSMTWIDLTHPDDRQQDIEGFDRMQKGEIPEHSIEKRIIRKNGSIAWIHITATMVRDIAGNPTSVIGTIQDTTGRKLAEEQLKESEERFRYLTENARVIIGIVQDRKLLYVNPYLIQQTGYSREELLSMDIGQIVHPDFRDLVLERARKRQLGEFVEPHYEFKVVTKDGRDRWIDFSAAIITYLGKPATIVVALDITERKQFEEALQDSEQRFRLVAEAAHIGGWQWNINGKIIADDQAKTLLGLSPDAQLTMPGLMQIIHADDRQRVESVRNKAVEEHADYDIEYRIVCPDLSIHWIHSRGHAYYGPDGKPLKMYGIISDVTERKQSEQSLRESEEKFRLLAENANAVIGIIQGRNFVYVNPYLEEASGYSREELLTINLEKMLHPAYRQMVLERAAKRQMGQEVESKYQFIMIAKSGQQRWMDFCAARIMYRGRPAIVGIAVDITEAKQVEEQLTILKNDLENKNRELESIIGIVSHDLRSPLVNIKGFVEELKKDGANIAEIISQENLSEETRHKLDLALSQNIPESLGFIETSASAMSRLVESLVQVARVGIAVLKPEVLDMGALVKEVIAGFEFKIKNKNIEITIGPLPSAFADKTQTTQIISNLIDNAIKYLDPNRPGSIRISGEVKEDQSLYCIEDNGIGIPKDKQHHIFEIFYRLETKLAAGEGIGLAMIKRMAIRNKGQIRLDSEPGKGSKFYVSLPKQP